MNTKELYEYMMTHHAQELKKYFYLSFMENLKLDDSEKASIVLSNPYKVSLIPIIGFSSNNTNQEVEK